MHPSLSLSEDVVVLDLLATSAVFPFLVEDNMDLQPDEATVGTTTGFSTLEPPTMQIALPPPRVSSEHCLSH